MQLCGIPVSKNFPWFIVIHTVKGFGKVNKAEVFPLHGDKDSAPLRGYEAREKDVGKEGAHQAQAGAALSLPLAEVRGSTKLDPGLSLRHCFACLRMIG